jgi:hypothetical protein
MSLFDPAADPEVYETLEEIDHGAFSEARLYDIPALRSLFFIHFFRCRCSVAETKHCRIPAGLQGTNTILRAACGAETRLPARIQAVA